jgi:hypothetical protein
MFDTPDRLLAFADIGWRWKIAIRGDAGLSAIFCSRDYESDNLLIKLQVELYSYRAYVYNGRNRKQGKESSGKESRMERKCQTETGT